MFVRVDGVYRAEPLLGFPWLEHGFGSRHSDGWAPPEETVTLKQVHSGTVIVSSHRTGCLGEGDALVTERPGARLAIRTADCIPLLLVDPVRTVVAAVHAGWKGTAAAIAGATVERMAEQYGCDPERIHAAIGPGIGPCCYEVGPDVISRLAPFLPAMGSMAEPAKVDLVEANLRQLQSAGVPRSRIYTASLCTQCRADEFFSYRRDRDTAGRMVSAIGIRPR